MIGRHARYLGIQVGDGLEMYVVFAKGRSPQGLQGLQLRGATVTELSSVGDGERVFVVRRDLKKD